MAVPAGQPQYLPLLVRHNQADRLVALRLKVLHRIVLKVVWGLVVFLVAWDLAKDYK